MSILDPTSTTLGDIITESLKECGAIGVGMTASAEDMTDGWSRCQMMLQEWQMERFLVFALRTLNVTSTGALSYSVGPAGDINTDVPAAQSAISTRPDKIERAFLRQLTNSQPNQVDYPLDLIQSKEDYDNIALKSLSSFPNQVFYDPQWPLGQLYPYPVPQANIYGIFITIKQQMPIKFLTQGTKFAIPFEYYYAIMTNLALRLMPKYGIRTKPGDTLPGLAKKALAVLRGANTAIARLQTPRELSRAGIYNIFSDRNY